MVAARLLLPRNPYLPPKSGKGISGLQALLAEANHDPKTNKITKPNSSIRPGLDFPFDFSLRARAPKTFVNEFGTSLSSLVPLSGGGKRPNIPIAGISSDEASQIVETIFSFAAKASKK